MTQKPEDGFGMYEYSWGATYEGEWRGGRMHGEGTYTFTNGDVYEGEFHDFHIHGKGIFTTFAWSFSGTFELGRPISGLLQEFGQPARGFAVKYDNRCAHIWDNPQPIEKKALAVSSIKGLEIFEGDELVEVVKVLANLGIKHEADVKFVTEKMITELPLTLIQKAKLRQAVLGRRGENVHALASPRSTPQ